MNKSLFVLVLSLVLLVSCSRHGKYESDGEIVWYSYWTFSFGTLHDTLPDADPATFKGVNEWLGHDAHRVYYKDKLVTGVDVSSLEAERYPLFRDKNDYYYMTTPMNVADINSFKVIKWLDDSFWAKDAKFAYFDTIRIEGVDLKTFKIKEWATAIDKNHVYRYGNVLELADPATYEENWKDLYSRDKSHIWYCGKLLEDVDYASFTVDKEGNASDKYGRFDGCRRVE